MCFLYREHQTRKNKKAGISTDRFQYIITAGYIVEPCLGIEDIAPVAQGVVGSQGTCHGTAGAENVAPGIVGVGDHSRSGGVQDGGDIPLEVGGIVVSGSVVGYRQGACRWHRRQNTAYSHPPSSGSAGCRCRYSCWNCCNYSFRYPVLRFVTGAGSAVQAFPASAFGLVSTYCIAAYIVATGRLCTNTQNRPLR